MAKKRRIVKATNNNTNTNVIGVYGLKGVTGKSAIKVKHLETFEYDQNQKIPDTCIHDYEIDTKNGLYGKVFARNITNNVLMASKKHPVVYISIYLIKPFRTALLYDLVLYFTIDDKINSYKEFLTKEINGKFSLELIREGDSRELDKNIDTFPGKNQILKMLTDFTLTDEMKEVIRELAIIEENKASDKFNQEFDYSTAPKSTISLKDYIITDDK